jgi:uncharacterized protein YndB with AHSA1/START domain
MTTTHQQLEVSRLIKADQDRVFSAWSDPELIVQWWGAGDITCTAAEMDLAVGGTYRIANQAPDGATMWITGTFQVVDRPHHLVYTWAMEPVTPDAEYSRVDVRFDRTDEGTLVTIVQTQIASPEARAIHLAGWVGCLQGLDTLLST